MANEEHLAILKQGVEMWDEWRADHPKIIPDFSRANLSRANLSNANFSKADLSGANFFETNLSGANIREARSNWANLIGANLGEADLSRTNLIEANLIRAHLSGADISGAHLSGANLSGANLFEANLSNTYLIGAYLSGANFSAVNFKGANLIGAYIGSTTFGDNDLSTVEGLETVNHYSPSIIGIDTIFKSKGNIPEEFLRGCGVPEDFIAFAQSIRGKAIEFYSCFISHSIKDKNFCERLYADLQVESVRTWYFPKDAKWGESVWGEIDRSIKIYDKLVVVCSENSLQRVPVQREIERALNREDKEGKNILFPIRIDDYIFDQWEHERKADVLEKVVGDFSGWDKDAAKCRKAFEKLLKGLQAGSTKV